jgi:high mobility group protein B3
MNKKNTTDRSKSKDRKNLNLSQMSQNCSTLGDFEDNILDIDIKKNRGPRAIFVSECFSADHKGQTLIDALPAIAKKWTALNDGKRKKYEDLAAEEKSRFDEHIGLVRKYLIQKPAKENATAYYLFLDDAVKRAIENNEDIKKARAHAKDEWKNLSEKETDKWEAKKEANHDLYDKLRNAKPGNVNGYALWVKDEIATAREKGNKITLTECAKNWPKVKEATRNKYNEYAQELREEKEKQRDLYEITFGIKPRRPLGAYNFYLQDMAKHKKFQGSNFFKECAKAWKKISGDEKEKYERIAKRDRLIHMVKKIEFNQHKRSTFKRAPSAYNLYIAEMRPNLSEKDLSGGKSAFQVLSARWAKESDATKKKFQKLSDAAKKDNETEQNDYVNRVFENPKRARSGYQHFLSERMPELKEKHSNLPTADIMKKVADEWNALKDTQKDKWNKKAEPEQEAYHTKMKEFSKEGFYTMDDKERNARSAKKTARSRMSKSATKSPAKSKNKKKKD